MNENFQFQVRLSTILANLIFKFDDQVSLKRPYFFHKYGCKSLREGETSWAYLYFNCLIAVNVLEISSTNLLLRGVQVKI